VTGIQAGLDGETQYPVRRAIGFSKWALGEGDRGGSSTATRPRLPKRPEPKSAILRRRMEERRRARE
jgi:hypothetical protein